jgi:CubicO group peptidase (beta-lactamase class C family)
MKMSQALLIFFVTIVTWQQPLFGAPVEITAAEDVGMSSARLAVLKSRLQQELDNEVTGGIQVLIARHGKVVMHENLGHASVEDNEPITDETLFRIYSMTKPIVGTAMMMLYEEGKFSLTDPLSMHIPEFENLQVYAGVDDEGNMILEDPDRDPTIQDLMQHTAGFTYGIFGDTPVDRMYLEKQIPGYDDSLQVMIEKLANTPLLYQPGERMVYSVAVDIQGYLIEKWTGKDLGEFLAERLFKPLGMDQTIAWVPPDKAELLANVYTHSEGKRVTFNGPFATNHFRAPGGFSGGGQLISTADDYWRFAQMLLDGGEFNGKRYLSSRTVDFMSRDSLKIPLELPYPGASWGLNFAVYPSPTDVNYPVSAGEYFWAGLASTTFWIDPKEDLVVVMLTQYLPFSDVYFRDLMHRLVHAAIID